MLTTLRKFLVYLIGINLAAITIFFMIDLNQLPKSERIFKPRNLSQSPTPKAKKEHVTEHKNGVHISEGGLIIKFIFLSLLLGGLLKEIKKKTNIPYSPMLLLSGILFGLFAKNMGIVGESIQFVNQIDPHTLLMIFIPTLVFESSYNTDGYTINKSKWQILIMAGPGVLLTSVIIAYSLQYVFGYKNELSISECLVIGSIVSTTDPVAVVALLKELGTSIKFNTILEGESLLNDGTAYVFFLICMEVVATGEFNPFSASLQFVRLSFGGPIFGLIAGWISIYWLKHILKDNSLIVLITFVVTYMVFFYSETYLKVSGILALVSLGLYLGTYAKVHFSHESDHAVHTVWSFISFCLETLIFLITGTYIGEALSNSAEFSLETSDIWKVLLFYAFLMLVRFLVLMIEYPFLNLVGYKIDFRSAVIMSWGGLRGAIALSLAMLVVLDERFGKRFKDLCLLYVISIIVLTVVFNGLTIKFLMKATGFLKKSITKEKIFKSVVKEIIVNTVHREEELKIGPELECADWAEVDRLGGIQFMIKKQINQIKVEEKEKERKKSKEEALVKAKSNPEIMEKRKNFPSYDNFKNNTKRQLIEEQTPSDELSVKPELNRKEPSPVLSRFKSAAPDNLHFQLASEPPAERRQLDLGGIADEEQRMLEINNLGNSLEDELNGECLDDSLDPFKGVTNDEIKQELRLRIYSLIRSVLSERHSKHLCSSIVVKSLRNICDICSDHLEWKICLWQHTSIYISDHRFIRWVVIVNSVPILGGLFNNYVSSKLCFEYSLIQTLNLCCHEIYKSLAQLPLCKDYHFLIEEVKKELMQDLINGEDFLDTLKGDFPDLVKMIHTKTASYAVVQYQKDQIHHFEKEGLINHHEKQKMDFKLDRLIIQINKYKPKLFHGDQDIKFSTFVLDFPAFRDLSEKARQMIQESTIEQKFTKNGTIYQEGDEADYIFLIIKGVAADKIGDYKIKKFVGGLMNFGNLCNPSGKYLSDCVTMTNCKMYKIRTCNFF